MKVTIYCFEKAELWEITRARFIPLHLIHRTHRSTTWCYRRLVLRSTRLPFNITIFELSFSSFPLLFF